MSLNPIRGLVVLQPYEEFWITDDHYIDSGPDAGWPAGPAPDSGHISAPKPSSVSPPI